MNFRPEAESELLRFMAKLIFATVMIASLAYPALSGDVKSPVVSDAIKTYGCVTVSLMGVVIPILLIGSFWIKRLRAIGGVTYGLVCGAIAVVAWKSSPSSALVWFALGMGGMGLASTGVRRGR